MQPVAIAVVAQQLVAGVVVVEPPAQLGDDVLNLVDAELLALEVKFLAQQVLFGRQHVGKGDGGNGHGLEHGVAVAG